MSKSSLVNYTKLSPNCSSRNGARICKITPHHMAGNLTIEQCAEVFQNSSRQASANYGIGSDGRIGCYVDENDRSWASANYDNDRQAITIEVANDEIGGNWHVSDKALESLINLCVDICKKYNFKLIYDETPNGSLTRHNMFVNTTCPGPYLQSKFPYIAEEVNKRLGGQSTSTPTTSTTSGDETIKYIQNKLNARYNASLNVDGIFGPLTKKAMVKGLQIELNTQCGARLNIDGIFGSLTKSACPNVKQGMKGNITWLIQARLYTLGFNTNGVDGIYGSGTKNAVAKYQSSVNIASDGICGKNTFEKLFK
jgi:hypothetical protein|uniref:N-acetylmuramoyl-L-alanine amidase n=1 Tax=Siphoviridae sp. ctGQT3 TaxID=2825412 RepID=A0A8S5UE03_9CAUD|nr:MAG TPA: lysozyme family protein [Siphoviridae sp. ctGQT3]